MKKKENQKNLRLENFMLVLAVYVGGQWPLFIYELFSELDQKTLISHKNFTCSRANAFMWI